MHALGTALEKVALSQITASSPELAERLEAAKEYWEAVTPQEAVRSMDEATYVAPTENSAGVVVLEPETQEVDATQSTVLALPYLNAWTEQHYVRARTLQRVIAPDSRMIVLPNNGAGQKHYSLDNISQESLSYLNRGNARPIIEQQIRTLQRLDTEQPLGKLGLTGYSFGGRIVLDLAGIGSSELAISAVNADETPSAPGRNARALQKAFLKSSSTGALKQAVETAQIPALSFAMRSNRLAIDVVRFGLATLTRDGKLAKAAMTKSALDKIYAINRAHPDVPIKLGHIVGSSLFDPELDADGKTLHPGLWNLRLRKYVDENLQAHASGDNPYTHAIMAYDGLVQTPGLHRQISQIRKSRP